MIHYKQGSIFDSKCDWLTNPVNCVGVMGAGLAQQFRDRYPRMYNEYKYECLHGAFQLGGFYGWINQDLKDKNIALIPTKYDWRDDSVLEDIDKSLEDFIQKRQGITWTSSIKSIAFPKLGCGLGGLDWAEVKPIMERWLDPISTEVFIEIWE